MKNWYKRSQTNQFGNEEPQRANDVNVENQGLDQFKSMPVEENIQSTGPTNPLDGKSNQQARNLVNRKIIPQDSIRGFFSDDSWEGVRQIWTAFDNAGLNWGVTDSNYYPTSDGHPMGGKTWNVEIKFTNNKGKPTVLGGIITAAGAGTVEDPLGRYDIVVYVY